MTSLVQKLSNKNLIHPPKFLNSNIHYETIMGSFAYGVSNDTSDCDVYGFCIPPKDIIFPHQAGVILGFDKIYNKFEQYQEHHVKFNDKEYDFTVYNIVKYFRLCADGNPNMIDSLFTAKNCILHMSRIGQIVTDNRKLFLSKKCWYTFKGYAYQQISAIRHNKNSSNSKRKEYHEKFGYDVKFAYHLIRLLNEIEQILTEGDLDLRRNSKQLKSVRAGEWTLEDVERFFLEKERDLERVYNESNAVPYSIREEELKQLLLDVLEEHFGSLSEVVSNQNKDRIVIDQIRKLVSY